MSMDVSMVDAEFVYTDYTGLLYNMVGTVGPINKLHVLDKICIPI